MQPAKSGIGNTTTSTALACILLDLKPQEVTGRGAGLDNAGLKRKQEVIAEAQHLYNRVQKRSDSVRHRKSAGWTLQVLSVSFWAVRFTGYL